MAAVHFAFFQFFWHKKAPENERKIFPRERLIVRHNKLTFEIRGKYVLTHITNTLTRSIYTEVNNEGGKMFLNQNIF